ncbi:hypothetical protein L484_021025 [Morus notabilis]|uniref:Uncharacterized protein n=1 Tax=Morus notabilis TaxID=981085 RepID=W9R4R2_9ROSA|nr:hypothetical protein L484_021025 [Morus notabilis]
MAHIDGSTVNPLALGPLQYRKIAAVAAGYGHDFGHVLLEKKIFVAMKPQLNAQQMVPTYGRGA